MKKINANCLKKRISEVFLIVEMKQIGGYHMMLKIIGTESLGVRGLCAVVKIKNRKIVIDPGIALGYCRHRLLPHPLQIAVGKIIREKIIDELEDATDIVISHFHGDHIPLADANPYQLDINQIRYIPNNCKIWASPLEGASAKLKQREEAIILGLNKPIYEAKGPVDDILSFSDHVPHGEKDSHLGKVTMTVLRDEKLTFVHASDIQFLTEKTILEILHYKPDIVLASGPPIYLTDFMKKRINQAWDNALALASGVETLIIDHHLLRCEEGLAWLKSLSQITGHRVICAADYMHFERHLLEAKRCQLYKDFPVADGWHEAYIKNKVSTDPYLLAAREKYEWFGY